MKKIRTIIKGEHETVGVSVFATDEEIEQGFQIIDRAKARRIANQICGRGGCFFGEII